MPLLVVTDELEAGMRLAEPVMAEGRILMQGGRVLTRPDVEVLRRRFPGFSVRVGDPVLDTAIEFEDDARERHVATQTQQRVTRCLTEVHERFARRASLRDVNVAGVHSTVLELLEYLQTNPVSAAIVNRCMDSSSYFGAHTGNVFYLSMLLGFKSQTYIMAERKRQTGARDLANERAKDLLPLGLAAMVMDLGMLPLQHLLNTGQPLTAEESKAIWEHPLTSEAALPPDFSPVARTAVKCHHEDFCGTGYPRGLTGDKIHVFARILRIADAFDAGTTARTYRQAKSPARVLWEMTIGPYRPYYDPELVKAFAGLIQPFPIGAKLRLKDGRYAAVVRYNRENPFDPKVIIAFDANNQPLPREQLTKPAHLSALRGARVSSLGDEDLTYLYTPSLSQVPSGRRRFATPLEAAFP